MSAVGLVYMFLVACITSLACNFQTAVAAETQLLSITGIKLQSANPRSQSAAQYVAGFNIKTWGVRVIAVCHIPAGWTVSAGKNANPEGVLTGSAGEGVAFIDAKHLPQLTRFFLVQFDDYHPYDKGNCATKCTPATFSGSIRVGTYGSATKDEPKSQRVLPSNIHLDPATECPDALTDLPP